MKQKYQTILFTFWVCLIVACANQTANVPSATKTPQVTNQVAKNQPTVVSSQLSFELKDTRINVSPQRGNIAWSHSGDRIAFTYHFTLWTVLADNWNKSSQVYAGYNEWKVFPQFIAWSPDDKKVGLNLFNMQDDSQEIYKMVEVNVESGVASVITTSQTMLTDWSRTNQIATVRPTLGVLDLSNNNWKELVEPLPFPDQFAGSLTPGIPRWTSHGTLVIPQPVTKKDSVGEYAVYERQLESNQWHRMPVQILTANSLSPILAPSPDGKWIAWVQREFLGNEDIWKIILYEVSTGKMIEAANNQAKNTFNWQALTWSPDAKRIAFSAGPNSSASTIWILEISE